MGEEHSELQRRTRTTAAGHHNSKPCTPGVNGAQCSCGKQPNAAESQDNAAARLIADELAACLHLAEADGASLSAELIGRCATQARDMLTGTAQLEAAEFDAALPRALALMLRHSEWGSGLRGILGALLEGAPTPIPRPPPRHKRTG
jgi:hypothetical protein